MKSFELTTEEIDEFLKKNKQLRSENVKKIKTTFKNLESKEDNPYEPALDRANKNLSFFSDNNFTGTVSDFNIEEQLSAHKKKMVQFDSEIRKMQNVIDLGCGTVMKKTISKTNSEVGGSKASIKSEEEN